MKRVHLRNRLNMTLLAKAFMENLFPKGKKGEVLFEKDMKTESGIMYFHPSYYDNVLIPCLTNSQTIHKIQQSNASNDWLNLVYTLKNAVDTENVNLFNVEHYSFVIESYGPIEYSKELLDKILKEPPYSDKIYEAINYDLKRIYPSIDFDVFRQEGILRTSFRLPLKSEHEYLFEFLPIIQILGKHNQKIININSFKGINTSTIYYSILFE